MGSDKALPRIVVRELMEKARRAGVSLEEFLFDTALKDVDPEDGARKCLEGAEELLEHATEELNRGDLREAGEKIWGACALAIKAHALHSEGIRLESHAELWKYKDKVAQELGDWVRIAFKIADSMHKNFYENYATAEDVKDALKDVKQLVSEVAKAVQKKK